MKTWTCPECQGSNDVLRAICWRCAGPRPDHFGGPHLPAQAASAAADARRRLASGPSIRDLRTAEELLGGHGRMLSPTKTSPAGEVVIWNAFVFAGSELVWVGDLNLTKSEPQILALAQRLDLPVGVYAESEVDTAEIRRRRPSLSRAAYSVTLTGASLANPRWIERGSDGLLRPPGNG